MAFKDLRYFIAAAQTQHFGRAAQALNMSQPAISRQIQDLEVEIGVALFDRLPRGVQLSTAGKVFLEHARQITLFYEQACEHARRVNRGEVGRLRVGFNDFSIGYARVPQSFNLFRARHPEVGLDLITMSSMKQLEALHDGQLDAGFLYFYENEDNFDYFKLGEENLLLALPASHPLAVKKSLAPADLAKEPFIGVRRDSMPHHHDRLIAACERSGLVPRIIQETHNEATLLRLISVEMGIGFVRSSLSNQVPKNVRIRPVKGISMTIRFGMVWRKNDPTPALQRFVAQVKSVGV